MVKNCLSVFWDMIGSFEHLLRLKRENDTFGVSGKRVNLIENAWS